MMPVMRDAYRKCTDCLPISMFQSAHPAIPIPPRPQSPGMFNSEHRVAAIDKYTAAGLPQVKRQIDRYDLRLFATPRSNCLLIGPDALVDDALTAWQPFLGHAPVFLASLYYRLNTMTISLGVPP